MRNLEFLITAMIDVANEADNRNLESIADDLTELAITISKFNDLKKIAYVKKIKENGKTRYEVKSKNNPDWSGGTYSTREKAEKRLAEIEIFKHLKDKKKS